MTDREWRKTIGLSDVVREKPKRKKKSSRKFAKDYADRCCREYAKKRYTYCVTCGKTTDLQWAHLLTSRAESTRWDPCNFAVQCRNCNFKHEHDPSPFTSWFLVHHGAEEYDMLAYRHHHPAHYKTADLEEIAEHYKKLIEEKI